MCMSSNRLSNCAIPKPNQRLLLKPNPKPIQLGGCVNGPDYSTMLPSGRRLDAPQSKIDSPSKSKVSQIVRDILTNGRLQILRNILTNGRLQILRDVLTNGRLQILRDVLTKSGCQILGDILTNGGFQILRDILANRRLHLSAMTTRDCSDTWHCCDAKGDPLAAFADRANRLVGPCSECRS